MPSASLLLIVALPLVAALLAPLLERLAGRWVGWLLAIGPLAAFALLLGRLPLGQAGVESAAWSQRMEVALRLRLDGLSLTMALLVSGIGALVIVYGGAYMQGKAGRPRLLALLLVFCAAMMGVVLADDAILLFVCWEATSFCSYLLVGFGHRQEGARLAARRALLITAFGGLALLGGLLLLADAARAAGAVGAEATSLAAWARLDLAAGGGWRLELASALILLGALTKSAQLPWHIWLPGAMSAPTPVSAYLHSATMVKAGVYLLARLQPALGGRPGWVVPLVLIGGATMLFGAWCSLRQRDLKRILAYSTLSVLGVLTLLLGLGTKETIKAAVAFLVAHALYKASLFMVAGNLDLVCRTRDVTRLGKLAAAMPLTAAAGVLAALSKAGAPPMFGFIGKELLYKAKLDIEPVGAWLLIAGVAANAMLVASALMVGIGPFYGRRLQPEPPLKPALRPGPGLWLPPLLLAVAGVFVGLVPGTFDKALGSPMASAIYGAPLVMKLTLWHGVSPAALTVLGLSALTLVAGVSVYRLLRDPQTRWSDPPAERLTPFFDALHAALIRTGGWLTDRWQHGSLAGYLRLALLGFTLPALVALATQSPPEWPRPFAPLIEGSALALGLIGVVVALRSRGHLAALCGLALVGLAVTLTAAASGSIDLAVTLLLVETLALVVLGLVLVGRDNPRRPAPRGLGIRSVDALIALGAGVAFTALAWYARGAAHIGDARDALLASALPAAGGRNVVNTILVDFRGLDTLGELAVLGVAGLVGGCLLLPRLRPAAVSLSTDSPTLRMACRPLTILLVVVSLASLLRGHNEPGGGFIGGLLVGVALTLDLIAFGVADTRRLLPAGPRELIAAGLLLAVSAGLIPLAVGQPWMSPVWFGALPGVGKVGTALIFDSGVYLIVVGVLAAALFMLFATRGLEETA